MGSSAAPVNTVRHSGEGRNPAFRLSKSWVPAFAGTTEKKKGAACTAPSIPLPAARLLRCGSDVDWLAVLLDAVAAHDPVLCEAGDHVRDQRHLLLGEVGTGQARRAIEAVGEDLVGAGRRVDAVDAVLMDRADPRALLIRAARIGRRRASAHGTV